VAVSKSEHLPEDGQVRLKHIAVDCDFKVNYGEILKTAALKMEVNKVATVPGI
jgi:hypothetical protein